jgi:hypothetical protein
MAQQDPQGEANVMSSGEDRSGTSKQREGVCHRCGWNGLVTKVGRRERKRLHIDKAYGRLCNECITDLSNRQSSSQGTESKLKAVRDRHVA